MGTVQPGSGSAAAAHASPAQIFQMMSGYQQTAALRAAVELDIFTAIGAGNRTTAEVATKVNASERGVRILCDYLTVAGLLWKDGSGYRLTTDSAMFLDQASPAFMGCAVRFLASDHIEEGFRRLTGAVRKGGTVNGAEGMMKPENPTWVDFAEAMAPMQRMPSEWMASVVEAEAGPARALRVLDIAAGHGLFGIAVAKRLPKAEIVAVDWPNVLEVARANADRAGVNGRVRMLPGDAFTVDYGEDYDIVLLANILHHFDAAGCEALLKRVRAAMKPNGFAVAMEFVPNDDRITPPFPAQFPLIMLAGTAAGDAYTFAEYERMFRAADFRSLDLQRHNELMQQVMVARQ